MVGMVCLGASFLGCAPEVDLGARAGGGSLGSPRSAGAGDSSRGDLTWSERFGGPGNQHANGLAVNAAGQVLLTGYFYDGLDLGPGQLTSNGNVDAFVAELDASGALVWKKSFAGTQTVMGHDVVTDAEGNVFVAGYLYGATDFGGGLLAAGGSVDVFLVKLDAQGNHVWSKRFGGGDGEHVVSSMAVDGAGNVVIAGIFSGSIDFGGEPLESAGADDAFVASFDEEGNPRWSARFGDGDEQGAQGVAVDLEGNVFVTGMMRGIADFGGGPLASAGDGDVFLAKLDSAGHHLWSRRFGDSHDQSGARLAIDANGGVIVVGSFAGGIDFGGGLLESAGDLDAFVAAFDEAGHPRWSRGFGEGGAQSATGVAVGEGGEVVVAGSFYEGIDFGGGLLASEGQGDLFLAALDGAGRHLWSKRLGDAADQAGASVATGPGGAVLFTGGFEGSVDCGGGPLVSAGGEDIVVARFAP